MNTAGVSLAVTPAVVSTLFSHVSSLKCCSWTLSNVPRQSTSSALPSASAQLPIYPTTKGCT